MTGVDVLVVGLGPAGCAAASAAASAGLSVLAVDRKQQVGVPVQCAEFIPLPLSAYAQTPGVIVQRIAEMVTALPSGALQHSDFPGLMIDRAAFDQELARQARQHGAQIWLASRLRGLDQAANQANFVTPQGERQVQYRVLIAADGPHSSAAKMLGLAPLPVVHTRQYTVPLRQASAATDIWLSADYPGGYAWLFPKGDKANLGVGADKACLDDLKAPLDRLHRRLVEQGVLGCEILGRTGGAIPVGGMRQRLVQGNVLFAGDAAGLTHPITGAGIAAAVVSGEAAGTAAASWLQGKPEALEEFEQNLREQFGATLQRAVQRRKLLLSQHGTAQAGLDETQRRGWIAFPEYFAA